jgi:DNA gyrase subunit B
MTSSYDAEQIQVIEGLEAIRKRPGMYIGSTGKKGLLFLIEELVNQSIEESLAGYCNNIDITLHRDGSFTVINDGLGISVDLCSQTGKTYLEIQLTCLSAFRKDLEQKYFISGGLYGTGIAVINAVSEWLEVTVWRDNKTYQQRYEKGKSVTKLQEKSNLEHKTGTSITFKPDTEIFADARLNVNTLKMRLRELAYLNAGINIILKDNYSDCETIQFHYPQGMKDYLVEINQNRQLINPEVVYLKTQEADIFVEVALQWCSDNIEEIFLHTFPGLGFYREWQYCYGRESEARIEDAIHLLSFANLTYTFLNGTHVDGVKQGIVKVFNNICIQKYPERELNLTWSELSDGLTGIVSVMLPEPDYDGSFRDKLANPEVTTIVSDLVEFYLTQYLAEYPQMIDSIIALKKL